MNRKQGFTLIEFVIVLVILIILSVGVSIPILNARRIKLDGAANRIMSDLRYAQQLALSRQVICGAVFDTAGNGYYVYTGNTSTKAKSPLSGKTFEVDFDDSSEYRSVDIVSTNFGNNIYFNYEGTPYNSGGTALSSNGSVSLQCGSFSQSVTIVPVTGEIKT